MRETENKNVIKADLSINKCFQQDIYTYILIYNSFFLGKQKVVSNIAL